MKNVHGNFVFEAKNVKKCEILLKFIYLNGKKIPLTKSNKHVELLNP